MIRKDLQSRMADFVTRHVEESGKYNILERNITHLLVQEKPAEQETPNAAPPVIDVLLHNYNRTGTELNEAQRLNREQGRYTAHVFYKDGKHFFVRLARRGRLKDERSLKKYTKEQIDAMVHLRKLEKMVLRQFQRFPRLVYYQPETARLEQGIRFFDMLPVELDYSHIGRDDPAYSRIARDGATSIDYRLPAEVRAPGYKGPIYLINGHKPTNNSLVSAEPALRRVA